jgi:tetrahydromethanopterin S-methyltransferase subunit C
MARQHRGTAVGTIRDAAGWADSNGFGGKRMMDVKKHRNPALILAAIFAAVAIFAMGMAFFMPLLGAVTVELSLIAAVLFGVEAVRHYD